MSRAYYRIHALLSRLNLAYLKNKYKNLSVGRNCRIDWNSYIDIRNNKCIIGDNVILQSLQKNYHVGIPFPASILIDVKGAKVEIGDGSSLHGVYVHAQKSIKIGKDCAIAAGVNIVDSNGHVLYSKIRKNVRDTPEEIIIGNNVWIGMNAIILKGTVLGDNCVVGAGSVVKGVYETNSLIVGNPAKFIKKIELEDII
jgi:acetyltransferase-like isoleucine patch superfamily enzyme